MKKKNILIITVVLIILVVSVCSIFIIKSIDENQKIKEKEKLESKLTEIKNHYSENVITNKKTKLYKQESDKYIEFGEINNDVVVSLEKHNITLDTEYFNIAGMDIYIYYKDVDPIQDYALDDRYKNYIYFNEKLKTKNSFSLYRDNNEIYKFNEAMDFQILIKDDNRYGVVYDNLLYYILKDDVEKIYTNEVDYREKATEIPVTVYHFLYLENEVCDEIICNSIKQVREEFDYLKQNNYFTINTKEMEYFINGKINLGKNSILITIDDGARATNFLPVLDEYKINATLFLISSWYKISDFDSNYLELASHTNNLHTPGVCSGGQGSPLKCMNKEEALKDLELSRKTLNDTEAFCFPFYEYNDYAIDLVKTAGFKIAYIGGDKKASIGINNYTIPRITIHNNISLDNYINLIK